MKTNKTMADMKEYVCIIRGNDRYLIYADKVYGIMPNRQKEKDLVLRNGKIFYSRALTRELRSHIFK